MNENRNPDEILEDLLPELDLPELDDILLDAQADALIDALTAEDVDNVLTEDAFLPEEVEEKVEFDLDAFLPDDPEELDGTEVNVDDLKLSSGYMDNYPELPDSVEQTSKKDATPAFDDEGEFDAQFNKKQDVRKPTPAKQERPTRKGRPRERKVLVCWVFPICWLPWSGCC